MAPTKSCTAWANAFAFGQTIDFANNGNAFAGDGNAGKSDLEHEAQRHAYACGQLL